MANAMPVVRSATAPSTAASSAAPATATRPASHSGQVVRSTRIAVP